MANETTAGDEHRQFVGNFRKVDFTGIAPMIEVGLGLVSHESGVSLQPLVAKSREKKAHLFVHDFRTRVVGNTPPENRNGELVRFFRTQLFVTRLKKCLVGPRSRQYSHLSAGKQEGKHFAELFPPAMDESNRIPLKLQRVAKKR